MSPKLVIEAEVLSLAGEPLRELVLALWLIAKGLREETPESPPGGVAMA